MSQRLDQERERRLAPVLIVQYFARKCREAAQLGDEDEMRRCADVSRIVDAATMEYNRDHGIAPNIKPSSGMPSDDADRLEEEGSAND